MVSSAGGAGGVTVLLSLLFGLLLALLGTDVTMEKEVS